MTTEPVPKPEFYHRDERRSLPFGILPEAVSAKRMVMPTPSVTSSSRSDEHLKIAPFMFAS